MIERIIDKRIHDLGGGFEVGRLLPFHARRMVGPYIFFDHMGPMELAPAFRKSWTFGPIRISGFPPSLIFMMVRSLTATAWAICRKFAPVR